LYLASIPNPGAGGDAKFLHSDDPNLIERWIKAENRPGVSVYYCPNPLKPGAARHGRGSIAAIVKLFWDIDFKSIVETPEEVDREIDNYSPARAATWRQFINIELANGDEVGVVAPWDFPGQGAPTPEKEAADRKAEQIFLHLLDKLLAQGINVTASPGPTHAPARLAKEKEAKAAKVSKAALTEAMSRLFDAGRIRSEPCGRSNRSSNRLVTVP
jgi:hypothetical protein